MSSADVIKAGSRYATSIVALLIALTLFMLTSMLILISLALHQNDAVDTLNDCTQPQGHCFQDANKRQGGAVQIINTTIICADLFNGEDAIKRCVADRTGIPLDTLYPTPSPSAHN